MRGEKEESGREGRGRRMEGSEKEREEKKDLQSHHSVWS